MEFLIATVVLVGLLGLLNLLFTFGVVRRLREHTRLLSDLTARPSPAEPLKVMLDPGETVGTFEARTVDDEIVTGEALTGTTLVGFFSTTCPACEERLPEFVAYARAHPGGRRQVLTVVVARSTGEEEPMISTLGDVARVIRVSGDDAVLNAFEVKAYPAFGLIGDDGVVRASAFTIGELTASGSVAGVG